MLGGVGVKTTDMSPQTSRLANLSSIAASPGLRFLGLLALCAAYIQGPITKLLDFGSALAEMEHFGLHPPVVVAIAVIVFELLASAMVLSGFMRWLGALALAAFTLLATFIALRFWELAPGMERAMATNSFFEHVGLAGAFVLVALMDIRERAGT
jgi:uncharacterized membrane protein YphA (DoxX/SURF4 family)